MKHLCCLFFTLALFLQASAETINVNGITLTYSTSTYDNTVSITACNDLGVHGNLVIPATINGYKVTSIGSYAFYGCSSLTSITIPNGVTSIGSTAFYGCSSLTSITIPNGVTEIEDGVFYGCSSLTSITIPDGVTSIGSSAFDGCSSLTSITIPNGVTSIGSAAFYGCSSLTLIIFMGDTPKGVENMDQPSVCAVRYSRKYGANWDKVNGLKQRAAVFDAVPTSKVAVDVEMTTPKTMRVTYKVTSDKEKVKVRAVAFKDGVRSLANLVQVKTAAEGSPESVPSGKEIATNCEHTFVWNVAADWDETLSKVAIEILVQEDQLLPQELITIPATKTHRAMTITRNVLTKPECFNALLWCVAEGDDALEVKNGVITINGAQVKEDIWGIWGYKEGFFSYNNRYANYTNANTNATKLLDYLYGKMGYKVLAGDDLAYAEAMTRLPLSSSNIGLQVSVKIEDGE